MKAARLFSPCTLASLAKKSLPCLDFHLVDEEEEAHLTAVWEGREDKQEEHLLAAQKTGTGQWLTPSNALSVICRKTRRDSMSMFILDRLQVATRCTVANKVAARATLWRPIAVQLGLLPVAFPLRFYASLHDSIILITSA